MHFSRGVAVLAVVASSVAGLSAITATSADATPCTPVVTSRGNFTAQLVNPPVVAGDVDATGCDIAVYYGPTFGGVIDDADVHGSVYYGVFNDGGTVTIKDSEIRDIGDPPPSGAQHGVAVWFERGAQGSVVDSVIYNYQKAGIVINGSATYTHTYADIRGNSITGAGAVDYIAQNGVQVSRGASATIEDNEISDNDYTPKDTLACGVLYFDADGVRADRNFFRDNERNVCNFGRGGGNTSTA